MALGVHADSAEFICHDRPMQPIEELGIGHEPPDPEQLFVEVYGMPKMMIELYHFGTNVGIVNVSDIAERFNYDRSTVSRNLRMLADGGYLERYVLNRDEGGQVHVYRVTDIEEPRSS